MAVKKEDIIQILEMLEARDGIITPHAVVAEAESEDSPIHDYFEWDDAAAAEAYRLRQARLMIRSVKVEIHGRETHGFWNAKVSVSDDGDEQGYFSLKRVLAEDRIYSEVLADALSELRYWQNKYNELEELKEIINEEALEELEAEAEIVKEEA